MCPDRGSMQVIGVAMRLLQKLVAAHDLVGEALVPYYRPAAPRIQPVHGQQQEPGCCHRLRAEPQRPAWASWLPPRWACLRATVAQQPTST